MKEGCFIKKQIHMKVLKFNMTGNRILVNGRTLKGVIEKKERGVRKLIVYQNYFLNSNTEAHSGTTEEYLLEFILKKSWYVLQFSKEGGVKKKGPVSEEEGKDYDSEEDIVINIDVDDPTDDFIPEKEVPFNCMPDGWSCYIAFVCEFTHCNDTFFHLFTGDGSLLSKSGAISRKEARSLEADESHANRNMELGGLDIGGSSRGISFDQKSIFITTGIKRSADKTMYL